MHGPDKVAEALELRERDGLGARRIAARTGLPVATVRDWLAGKLPRSAQWALHPDAFCETCRQEAHDVAGLPPAYVYLLGIYLGDGSLAAHHHGGYHLRVSLDARYPGIVDECVDAIRQVAPTQSVGRLSRETWVVVWSYSRSWPCLFPQHGPGKKHERRIELVAWQQRLVVDHPYLLLRGLIHSDGCRSVNTGRNWANPRYSFVNRSDDIRRIFCDTCDLVGVRYTHAPGRVYVSRKADVELLDRFIGPKR